MTIQEAMTILDAINTYENCELFLVYIHDTNYIEVVQVNANTFEEVHATYTNAVHGFLFDLINLFIKSNANTYETFYEWNDFKYFVIQHENAYFISENKQQYVELAQSKKNKNGIIRLEHVLGSFIKNYI